MSQNLMSTEPGGEARQYEGDLGIIDSHAKQAGQLGDPATQTHDQIHKSASKEADTQGVTSAEKMRYGQAIQESGGGAGRTDASGRASSEGGFGGTARLEERLEERGEGAAQQRRVQGYGGSKDMDRTVGA